MHAYVVWNNNNRIEIGDEMSLMSNFMPSMNLRVHYTLCFVQMVEKSHTNESVVSFPFAPTNTHTHESLISSHIHTRVNDCFKNRKIKRRISIISSIIFVVPIHFRWWTVNGLVAIVQLPNRESCATPERVRPIR